MADAEKSPDDGLAPLGTTNVLQAAWDRFRSGDMVPCPVDQAPLALAVDASAAIYRFVCTQCGTASHWFESGPTGIRVRGPSSDQPPHPD